MTHASVFWINDRLTSIVNIKDIPAEDRYKEAVSRVRFSDGKSYPARTIAISDNMKQLENTEDQFMSHLKESAAKSLPKTRKNRGQQNKYLVNAAATEKQVSLALGEKPRLDNKLSAVKGKTVSANKVLKKNQKETDREIQLALLNIKTSLISHHSESNYNSDHDKQKDIQQSVTNTNKTTFNTSISEHRYTSQDLTKSGTTNKINASSRKRRLSDTEDMIDVNIQNFEYGRNSAETEVHCPKNESIVKTDEDIDQSDYGSPDLNKARIMNSFKDMCTSYAALKRHKNSTIKEFIWDLGAFFGMDLKSSMPRKSIGSKVSLQMSL